MNNGMKIAALVAAGALVAGCSSMSGPRAKKDQDSLNTRLAALEGQVTTLNQRVEELAPAAPASQANFEGTPSAGTPAQSAQKPTVRQIQRALASAGFYKGSIDGKDGPKTKMALREFQRAQGLKVDGVVGSSTRQALAKYLEPTQAQE